jgi:hypothetical protein
MGRDGVLNGQAIQYGKVGQHREMHNRIAERDRGRTHVLADQGLACETPASAAVKTIQNAA